MVRVLREKKSILQMVKSISMYKKINFTWDGIERSCAGLV